MLVLTQKLSQYTTSKSARLSRLLLTAFFTDRSLKIGQLWGVSTWQYAVASFFLNWRNAAIIGSSFTKPFRQLSPAQKFEHHVMSSMVNYFQFDPDTFEAQASSGSTESLLTLLWAGRDFMEKNYDQKPMVITNQFTHYAVSKATRITNLCELATATDLKHLTYDFRDLTKKVLHHYLNNNQKCFLLLATYGYTQTGVHDSIPKLENWITSIQKKYPDLQIKIIIDAATDGVIAPLTDYYQPKVFFSKSVIGITTDFHKWAQAPVPTGLLIIRKEVSRSISRYIPYLNETDNGLLGSRPFSTVVNLHLALINLQRHGQKAFQKSLKLKQKIISKIQQQFHCIYIVDNRQSPTFLLYNTQQIPDEVVTKLGMLRVMTTFWHDKKSVEIETIKAHVLPHHNSKILTYLDSLSAGKKTS